MYCKRLNFPGSVLERRLAKELADTFTYDSRQVSWRLSCESR